MLVNGKDVYDWLGDVARKTSSYFTNEAITLNSKTRTTPLTTPEGHIASIKLYDSMAFLRYKAVPTTLTRLTRGSEWLPVFDQ